MAVSDISATSSLITNTSTDNAASIAVLKKALQVEQQVAIQLIESVSQPAPTVDPVARLGQNIDVKV